MKRLILALLMLCLPGIATAACTGVSVSAGSNAAAVQALINANPNGTTFCFAAGTYLFNTYVSLKEGNKVICTTRRTCTVSGSDVNRGAFTADYGSKNQLIQGFIIERFIATSTYPIAGLQIRMYGTIDDNEVRLCQTGIDVGEDQTISNNFVHDNRQYGISGGPGNNILIVGNEISFNNTLHLDPDNDAGGTKIVGSGAQTRNLTWRNNYVHDNYGQGLWSDGNLIQVTYEDNRIEDNGGAGIMHEISWDAVIRNNTLKNNLTLSGAGQSCYQGAEILISNSRYVAVYGNTIENSAGKNPICIKSLVRSEPAGFPQLTTDVIIQGNTIKSRGAATTGWASDQGTTNIKFLGNTYYFDAAGGNSWQFLTTQTKAQWQAAGRDASGVFLTW